MKTSGDVPGSFRDPAGSLFFQDGVMYRRINMVYKEHYDHLMACGLYEKLTEADLLIPHTEVDIPLKSSVSPYKVIRPEVIPFISYPYEWCFSQLKDAALSTLRVQKTALSFDMILKDASAYNIQFRNGKPVHIDTLSFEKYREGAPWIAYGQFCQHFLAPLALMRNKDIRLNQLSRIYIDGIPLDLASALLPRRTAFRFGLLSHIHFHAKSQRRFADTAIKSGNAKKVSRMGLSAIVDSLESTVKGLKWKPDATEWSNYYEEDNYSSTAFDEKKRCLSDFLEKAKPASVWDIGANIGIFSRVASDMGIPTMSFDIDPAVVERNYLDSVRNNETNILPLLIDVKNPSPGIGWANEERMPLLDRGHADAIFALALIHHLAISNNVPLGKIALFFSRICKWLIIEFVPKTDSQVQRLLRTREDVFPDYNEQNFEAVFEEFFEIHDRRRLADSERILYLMEKRQPADSPD